MREAERAIAAATEAEDRSAVAAAALRDAELAGREAEAALAALGDAGERLARRLEEAAGELEEVGQRRAAGLEAVAALRSDLDVLGGKATAAAAELDAARAALRSVKERGEGLRSEAARLEEKRAQAQLLLVRLRERRRATEEERTRALAARDAVAEVLARSRTQAERLSALLPVTEELASILEGLGRVLGGAVDEAAGELEGSRRETEGFAERVKTQSHREAELLRESGGLSEALLDAQVALTHLEDRAAERSKELAELQRRHASPRELGVGSEIAESREQLEGQVERLERRGERMGPVNPLAEHEYRETSERAAFLAEQRRDLEASLRELRRVIAELDDHIETTFMEMFEAAKGHFEEMVAVLFPGGRGTLKLVEVGAPAAVQDADPEEGAGAATPSTGDDQGPLLDHRTQLGITVEIKPPRKAPRSLSLLSGGEKALAAVAFLFALFLARPAPFYLLDEVEAALDDVNIGRFLELVRRYQDRTQFIIVTHQRRTMEVADSLYGVAMDTDGTSRVLSRRLVRLASTET